MRQKRIFSETEWAEEERMVGWLYSRKWARDSSSFLRVKHAAIKPKTRILLYNFSLETKQ